ncbi:hypothetical protein [Corynebacterium sp. H130]|uniref:hypothetical protein n=1 Tax=Corynebacterium sp. H130 TaxID=3133444 RepID=UPI0030A30DE3
MTATHDPFSAEMEGLEQGLSPRQLRMIAIGSAIGTGLFLGAGGRLHNAGPSVALLCCCKVGWRTANTPFFVARPALWPSLLRQSRTPG